MTDVQYLSIIVFFCGRGPWSGKIHKVVDPKESLTASPADSDASLDVLAGECVCAAFCGGSIGRDM